MQFTLFLDRLSGGAEVVRTQHWSVSLLPVRDQPLDILHPPEGGGIPRHRTAGLGS
jgi:hypothetical protein